MNFTKTEIIGNDSDLNWDGLLGAIRSLDKVCAPPDSQWIFRAVDKCKEAPTDVYRVPLTSSLDDALERRAGCLMPGDRRRYESWILYDFKRETHNYLNDLPERKDFLEWLALGRHYEMPSRLVDFTYSFFVAAYFALSKCRSDEDGLVVAINLSWMKKDWEDKLATKYGEFEGDAGSFHNRDLFQEFAFRRKETYAVVVNSLRRNPRLARQHGCFVCPGNVEESFDHNLAQTLGERPDVKRLVRLRSGLKTEAMRDLMRMNITLATLYPDLTGWAQSRRDLVHCDITDDRFRRELDIAMTKPRL